MATKRTVEKIVLKNFKAFRQEQSIDFKNNNVLIYGNNGAGKSSIFWALYTFLQSSIKDKAGVDKYFKVFDVNDDSTHQSLRNVFESNAETAHIELTIKDGATTKTYTIPETIGAVIDPNDTNIKLLNTTSDFINYKLLSGFYRDSHQYDVNLWNVFERDIFPFITDNVTDQTFLEKIKENTKDVERYPSGYKLKEGWRKDEYKVGLEEFNVEIDNLLGTIQQYANEFIKEHFYNDKDVLEVELRFDKRFHFDLVEQKIWEGNKKAIRENELQIKLIVKQFDTGTQNWIPLHRVQSFLNEAQLTRIALGIRIGALRSRLQTAEFKLLVLDDMLISLDLSNRMEVVKIILNHDNKKSLKFFDSFQKIILTHDKGFYNILKNYTNPNQWEYYKLTKEENSNNAPNLAKDKTHIEKASKFFSDGEYDAVGNELRKEVETILKKYLNAGLNKESEDFQELSKMLNSAHAKYTQFERLAFEKIFVDKDLPIDFIKKIDTDFENATDINATQKLQLRILKNELHRYLYRQYEVKNEKDKHFQEIRVILNRIMNPASHASGEAMYERELESAIEKVKALKVFLGT
jgi:ABC-type dipeptide/oligopeptide/nickel transport system ATPase subunit